MEQGVLMDFIRSFFAFIDGIIYNLISDAHNLVIEIAHFKVFENVNELTSKVYAALGIFMLFKVSFSFINYLINPDSFTDKEKGVQHVIKNIVIMFIMLISCPWAFGTMWNLQADILDEAVIENFIFGNKERSLKEYKMMDSCDKYSIASTNGDYIALMILRGFYKPYTANDVGYDLSNDNDYNTDYATVKKKLCSYVINGTPSMYLVSEVYNADADVDGTSIPIIEDDLDIYIMDYKILLSTAVGVVVLLILVSFAMDVGLRVVKLSFLELLAPIPIVSYIDPASGKNGMFKKWIKEVGSTWASVFIRLLALYFSVRVIQEVGYLNLHHVSDPSRKPSVWVVIFVIIGALMFAKQLPKLIQNITGINLDGGFSINPLKKIKDNALGGNRVLGLGAGAAATTMAGVTNLADRLFNRNTWHDRNGNRNIALGFGRVLGSGIAGATRAGVNAFNRTSRDGNVARGAWNGYQTAMYSKLLREDNRRKGGNWRGSLAADFNRYIGRLNEGQFEQMEALRLDQEIEQELNGLEARQRTLDSEKRALATEKQRRLQPFKQFVEYGEAINKAVDRDNQIEMLNERIRVARENGGEIIETSSILGHDGNPLQRKISVDDLIRQRDNRRREISAQVCENNASARDALARMQQLAATYEELSELGQVIDENGSFNRGVVNRARNQADVISRTFDDRSAEYEATQREIDEGRRTVNERKYEERYIRMHDKDSPAKVNNATRMNNDVQPPGATFSPGRPAQAQMTDQTYFDNMNNGNGGGAPRR